MRTRVVIAIAAVLAVSVPVTCAAASINAAGATFPAPIYQKWFEEYHAAHSDVEVNYQAIGSGGGIAQLTAGTVDFGASDMPMKDDQMAKITKFKVLHFPTVLGGVVPTYNIEGVSSELKFTPDTLAGIYLGKITKWSDAALKKDNPGVKFPNADITVVHRSDGSGTTFVWTDYLSKISPEWKSQVGSNTSVKWPVGLGGKGNEGVAGVIRQQPGAIGYVELIYALQNKITFGPVKNSSGNFIKASLDSTTAAAASVKKMPADFRVSITNSPGKDAYPIASFTYLLVPTQWQDQTKKNATTGFLEWMLDNGESMVTQLDYAPLPKQVADMERAKIKDIH